MTHIQKEGKMYQIKLIESATEDVIKQCIELDHGAFPFEDWITEEEADLIYRNKKNCAIWLTQDGEPVGLVTVFALNEKIPKEAMEKNKPIYKLLTQDILSDADTGVLYCHCFLLLPQCRGKGLIYNLYEGLKLWLEEKGGVYNDLYADAVSEDGRRCLERLGFFQVHSFGEAGALYSACKENVLNAIKIL
jgi:GNAT superfamily N-acetyltransferase